MEIARMRLCKMVASIGVATLLFSSGLLGEALAQTIQHEVNGQTRTFDFKQGGSVTSASGQPIAAPLPRRQRPSAAELPRGPKNIPWDEPGKISGVPGVQENSATSLPGVRGTASRARRARTEARVAPNEEGSGSAPQPVEPRRPDGGGIGQGQPGALMPSEAAETVKPATAQAPRRDGPDNAPTPAEAARLREEAEAKARIIAEATARALAEEQRRLDLERSKDRHARRPDQQPAGDPMVRPAAPAQPDPPSTGTIPAPRLSARGEPPLGVRPAEAPSGTTALMSTEAPPATSSWKDGLCRKVFFGIMPGC
jgi:hypothetical protein